MIECRRGLWQRYSMLLRGMQRRDSSARSRRKKVFHGSSSCRSNGQRSHYLVCYSGQHRPWRIRRLDDCRRNTPFGLLRSGCSCRGQDNGIVGGKVHSRSLHKLIVPFSSLRFLRFQSFAPFTFHAFDIIVVHILLRRRKVSSQVGHRYTCEFPSKLF